MENASKALIIAGAILVSILIIGLGVYIYTNASATVKRANLNSAEAQANNEQYTASFGDNVSSAEVKSLLNLVRSNNITSNTNEEAKSIVIKWGAGTGGQLETPTTALTHIKAGERYKVQSENEKTSDVAPYNDSGEPVTTGNDADAAFYKNGYIRVITISKN